ncbi:HTH-type transcriptional repressor NsrR [Mycobacteroides abscessus subsp. bolletii]|uniref:RrF2 family transcriptional regulator n=1 Tax=Mycobacteroides abscessus TaxID=36809 RepID=UPI0009A56DBB|nr:Rrf2 family transcriptional regulator [Mycobacteroides abscessus]SKH10510.1 HTH-type transcriptional repressor nsrR [Mycobacteroides abscessus subsp. bolletii]SLF06983.1 HTH-type transcriptional repressor NsrR [Mycobacteroides abscessus subsp. bolletii]
MQLTRFTDLGLRIVMRLAVEGPNAQLHTDDLAAQLCVSYTHATKVVARLSEMGTIESTRGRHGGVRITQDGLGRRVGSLARKLERSGEVIDCEGDPPCPLRRNCRLREALRSAQDAFFTHLDQWTVAEIARPTMERK